MYPRKRQKSYGAALAILAISTMVFAASPGAFAQPQTPGSDLSAVPKEVTKDPQGTVRQVVPKEPIPVPVGTPAEAPKAAQAHAGGVAKSFNGNKVGDLVVDSTFAVGNGTTVRLRQEIDSVPVFAAAVSQSLAADGSLLAATGSLSQRSQGKYPSTKPSEAVGKTAIAKLAGQAKLPADKFTIARVTPYWYDAQLASVPDAKSVAVPAFKVDVHGDGDKNKPGRWVVFVDATDTGKVLDSWDDSKHVNRVVCDAKSERVDIESPDDPTVCGSSSGFAATRKEGQGPVGIADVDNIFDYFGTTEGFYAKYTQLRNLTDLIGSDTRDGNGKALRGTVRICTTDECPYANAFWTGDHMAFGSGLATEDITGHELSHGVTEHTSGLVYRNEPGAINESMSDIFGELVFLTNTSNPCNIPANRWQIGACSSLGVIRDMQNPKAHRQPDTYKGPNWYTGSNQSVLVHTNSGVGNKAAQLMVDGGSLNGQAVTAIGLPKTAALYWTTQTVLTANSTYGSLASALVTACNTNVRNGVAGTTAADCVQVDNAIKAVKLPRLNQST
ncbi:M4 family metallopeptidase [Nocardia sp. NPDC049149]|uniref:M4 family metallopeptidase n=1 Tax=Nocardia sp. NPDC049149 TaxID=3364315 RepID=UPI0037197918